MQKRLVKTCPIGRDVCIAAGGGVATRVPGFEALRSEGRQGREVGNGAGRGKRGVIQDTYRIEVSRSVISLVLLVASLLGRGYAKRHSSRRRCTQAQPAGGKGAAERGEEKARGDSSRCAPKCAACTNASAACSLYSINSSSAATATSLPGSR